MKDAKTGSRIFVMSASGWASIKKELADTFPTESGIILERMGYSYGADLASSLGRASDKIGAFGLYVATNGWGKLTVLTGDPLGTSSSLGLNGCVFCSSMKGDPSLGCTFFTGVLHGLLDELADEEHAITESKCECRGDPVCQFDVETTEMEH